MTTVQMEVGSDQEQAGLGPKQEEQERSAVVELKDLGTYDGCNHCSRR